MNRRKVLLGILVVILISVILGYIYMVVLNSQTSVHQTLTQKEVAIEYCLNMCKTALSSGQDILNGPCLANEVTKVKGGWLVENWVCDVTHNPRQPVDDLPENQCSAYREGKAKHFVEVDENCELIRAV